VHVIDEIGRGFWNAFEMFWEVGWALVLGFLLSGIVQAWIPRERMERALGGRGARELLRSTGLGAASSSCSYAAIAIAKSLFQKGASFASAMAFQFASTNLVFEIGIVMWIFLGWEFTLAEFVGGVFLITLMWAGVRPRARACRRDGTRASHGGHRRLGVAGAADIVRRLVRRRAQLPRRLGDALEGDRLRLPDRRFHRAAAALVLQRTFRD
jgi:hypothetical protein